MSDVHAAAWQGFGAEARTYARGRPEYPPAIDDWLNQALGVRAGVSVLDLGAGTGKFTRRLLATGADVVAVEPVDAMRGHLAAELPAVRVLAGTAQDLPLADASVDAIVCAQAFHWFADGHALAQMHRVLRPGGRLGLVWNVRDESVDWVAEVTRIITPYEGDAPRFHKGDWRKPFDGRLFDDPVVTVFPHSHVGSPQAVIIDRCLSVSFIASRPDDVKSHVAAQLQRLIDTHPALRGQAQVAFPYRTEAYCCQRR